jgi:hypothetical protein
LCTAWGRKVDSKSGSIVTRLRCSARATCAAFVWVVRGTENQSPNAQNTFRVSAMFSKRICVAWFVVHFFLITAVCFAGIFSLVAEGATMLPSPLGKHARKAELIAALVLGKQAAASNPVRQGVATYLHAAGIQAGYSFFAPNIPGYHKLIFELYHEDGRVEYESPHVSGKAAALRLDSLLDRLADNRYEPIREVVVKMLALSIWRERPEVKKIRAIFRAVTPPGISDFEHGKGETLQPMFSYDFSLREEKQ